MQTFNLTITLGNDAMQTPEDISSAPYDAAENIMHGAYPTGIVWDENAHKVGEWNVSK